MSDDALAIVIAALDDRQPFTLAALALERKTPSERAAAHLVATYASNGAPPWLVALLLGANGHDDGYATAHEILVHRPELSAAVYAGPAMAKIRGRAAFADLAHVLHEHSEARAREGAAYGLAYVREAASIDAVLRALRERKIRRDCAAPVLADLPLDDETLCAWLEGTDDPTVALALVIVGHRSARGPVRGRVAELALAQLESEACPIRGSSWMRFLPERLRS